MIGYLEGTVLGSDTKKVILKVGGIGYEVNFNEVCSEGSELSLFIHHHITDADQNLWGFRTLEEKQFFELLKSVNKVGASKAFALLVTLGNEQIITAIKTDSPNMLAKAPGIGKKMAEQIILSLRDKVDSWVGSNTQVVIKTKPSGSLNRELFEEVVLALSALGYRDNDVVSLVKKSIENGATDSQEIVKNVLREL